MAIFRPKPSQIFFFCLVPKSPIHIGLIYVKNPKPNISCLGPFLKQIFYTRSLWKWSRRVYFSKQLKQSVIGLTLYRHINLKLRLRLKMHRHQLQVFGTGIYTRSHTHRNGRSESFQQFFITFLTFFRFFPYIFHNFLFGKTQLSWLFCTLFEEETISCKIKDWDHQVDQK